MRYFAFTALVALFLCCIVFNKHLVQKWSATFNVYQVNEITADPRYFEQMESFQVEGTVVEGWSVPGLFKVFVLQDVISNQYVLIIPKSRTLPIPGNDVRRFRVQVYAEPHLLGHKLLILEEIVIQEKRNKRIED